MEKLKELYHKRQVFVEFGSPVPEELQEQIRAAEIELITPVSETVIGYLPDEIDMPDDCTITIGVEYCDGKLVRVASSLNSTLFDNTFQYITEIDNAESDDDPDDPDSPTDRQRSKSIGFTVKFADGKTIKYSTAQRTMIEALRYMGLERASKFSDETFKGYPLIGKVQRTTDDKLWQRMVDGWWVYINMGNERKITCLKGVAKMLNIDIEIIPDEE